MRRWGRQLSAEVLVFTSGLTHTSFTRLVSVNMSAMIFVFRCQFCSYDYDGLQLSLATTKKLKFKSQVF